MNELAILNYMTISFIALAFATFFAMTVLNIRAPYGRYHEETTLQKWSVSARTAWFLKTIPAFIIPYVALYQAHNTIKWTNLCIVLMFTGHYINRAFLYPYLIRGGKPMAWHMFVASVLLISWNAYIQSFYHAKYANYSENHTSSLAFLMGFVIYLSGMLINCHADNILRNLRKPYETGYKIPHGGAFEYVSCANYFGEMLEWFGYAMCAQTMAGFAYLLWTMGNIIPRAIQHHRWYHQKFDNYPKERRAVIPFML